MNRCVTATRAFIDGWQTDARFRIEGARLMPLAPGAAATIVAHIPGTVLPGFTDSHVHLGLIDGAALAPAGVARVVDLGWDPGSGAGWKLRGEKADESSVCVEFVGALLTVPGGYPLASDWAPAAAVRTISTPEQAELQIVEMEALGASAIKITLNSDAGPVFSDDLLRAVVATAHHHRLPVVAHCEGSGQAERAFAAGVDRFAHSPWSERLSDELIAAMSAHCSWVSTLDIHGYGEFGRDFAVASDNLARFAAAGGTVLYGTDLGNGALPVGINPRELAALSAAGLSREGLLRSVTPQGAIFGPRISWVPDSVPVDNPASWLAAARVALVSTIEENFA